MAGEQSTQVFKGKITFGDKTYDCQVVDGVRYIDGKTVDEFLATLDQGYQDLLAEKGKQILTGKKPVKN